MPDENSPIAATASSTPSSEPVAPIDVNASAAASEDTITICRRAPVWSASHPHAAGAKMRSICGTASTSEICAGV